MRGGKAGSTSVQKRILAKKQVQNKQESDRHGAVGLHQPPTHELLPKWRLELMRLTQEALNEVEKEREASTRESSSKPSSKAHNPGAIEVRS